jgi:hypothetical protein
MRGLRVVLAMLVGACIGAIVIVLFYRDRFDWPAFVPSVVVPVCLVIASAAVWKWYWLDIDIAEAVDRAIERLSRSSSFEASISKTFAIGTAVGTVLLVALVFAPTREPHTALRVGLGLFALIVVACGMVLYGWALKPGATLVMDTHGLRHAAFGRIPWEAIVGLQYEEIESRNSTVRLLNIAIASPHRFAHQLPRLARILRPELSSPATRFGELKVSLNALDQPHEVIVAAAYEFRGRVDAPFADAWETGMAPQKLAALLAN